MCYRDSSNNPKCQAGSNSPPPPQKTTKTTTTTHTTSTTIIQTTPTPTIVSAPPINSTPAAQNSIPTSVPPILPPPSSSSLTSHNTTVLNNDPHITYSPASAWNAITVVGACIASPSLKESKTAGSSLSFTFQGKFFVCLYLDFPYSYFFGPKGSGIAVHVISSNLGGTYSITVDSNTPQMLDSYNPAAIQPQCSTPYSIQTLSPSAFHTVTIETMGQSPNAVGLGSGQFDFDSFT
jgi:hypothetical protein